MLRTLWRCAAAAAMCIGLAAGPAPAAIAADPSPSPSAGPVTSPAVLPSPSLVPCPTPDLDASPSPSAPTPSASPVSPTEAPLDPSASPAASPDPCVAPLAQSDVPEIGMGVGPGQVILDAETHDGMFTVYNAGETDQMFAAVPFDYLPTSDGKRVPAEEPVPLGAAAWLSMEPAEFTLAPGESQQVRFSVTVPERAVPGDHWAGIRFLSRMTEQAWNDLRARLPAGINMRSQLAFPVTVVTRVPGEIEPRVVAPPPIPAVISTFSGDVIITTQIHNEGNTAAVWHVDQDAQAPAEELVPTLRMTAAGFGIMADDRLLYATAGQEDAARPASVMVLPGASLEQKLVLRDAPMLGTYTYQYTLPGDPADGRPPVVTAGKVFVINVHKIVLYVILPIVAGTVLIAGFVLMRMERGRRSRLAAVQRQRELEAMRAAMLEQARQEAATRPDRPW